MCSTNVQGDFPSRRVAGSSSTWVNRYFPSTLKPEFRSVLVNALLFTNAWAFLQSRLFGKYDFLLGRSCSKPRFAGGCYREAYISVLIQLKRGERPNQLSTVASSILHMPNRREPTRTMYTRGRKFDSAAAKGASPAASAWLGETPMTGWLLHLHCSTPGSSIFVV